MKSGINGLPAASGRKIAANAAIYGITHGLVDAACAALLFGYMAGNRLESGWLGFLVILYNVLAFALQPLLGLAADRLRMPAAVAAAGCVLTAAGVFAGPFPLAAVCLVGVGNALFHVGGGVVSLNLVPGRAAMPGVYVAPGALGLMVGTLVGKSGLFSAWIFAVLLAVAALSILLFKGPGIDYDIRGGGDYRYLDIILLLLLVSVAVRGLVGLALNFPWKSNIYLLVGLTSAVVLGKALGGILADKLGWSRVTVTGLVLSALLISLGFENPWLSIPGVFLFNLTMPVTLVAVANMLPGRAGFAFGLTALALIAGSLPVFAGVKATLYPLWVMCAVVLVSALILYKGLGLYSQSRTRGT